MLGRVLVGFAGLAAFSGVGGGSKGWVGGFSRMVRSGHAVFGGLTGDLR